LFLDLWLVAPFVELLPLFERLASYFCQGHIRNVPAIGNKLGLVSSLKNYNLPLINLSDAFALQV